MEIKEENQDHGGSGLASSVCYPWDEISECYEHLTNLYAQAEAYGAAQKCKEMAEAHKKVVKHMSKKADRLAHEYFG